MCSCVRVFFHNFHWFILSVSPLIFLEGKKTVLGSAFAPNPAAKETKKKKKKREREREREESEKNVWVGEKADTEEMERRESQIYMCFRSGCMFLVVASTNTK